MIELIKELKKVMEEKRISPETAGNFIGVSGRTVRRWIEGESIPLPINRKAIRKGLKQILRVL